MNCYFRQFYLCFKDIEIVNSRVHNLTWTHIRHILRVDDEKVRLWYMNEALVDRQMHIPTEKNDYYIDLVFYNYILRCFVLVDLKTEKITYEDVGQMSMYRKMFDEKYRPEGSLEYKQKSRNLGC